MKHLFEFYGMLEGINVFKSYLADNLSIKQKSFSDSSLSYEYIYNVFFKLFAAIMKATV